MKKTLVALAAVAATSAAFAEVKISGAAALGINAAKTTTSGKATTVTTLGDPQFNSSLNFNVSEDIGNGLKAEAQIGLYPYLSTNDAPTGYQSFIGLSGGFGGLKAGKFADAQALVNFTYDAVGAWGANQANFAGGSLGGFFLEDQVKYTLPTLVNGLTASYTRGFGEDTGGLVTGNSNTYALGYSVSGFAVDIANSSVKNSLTETKTINNIGLSYDFGVAKVVALSASQKNGTNAAVTGSSFGVIVPVGDIALTLQTSTASGTIAAAGAATSTVKQTGTDVKVSYTLSKRTVVHALMNTRKGSDGITAASGNSVSNTQLFVLHAF